MTDTKIEITRTFDAPREAVFDAWTTPEHFAAWFGTLPAKTTLDVRVGGQWRATMEYEGNEMNFWGEYQQIDRPELLVLTFTDTPEGISTVTVTFTEDNGATTMTMTQVGPLPEDQLDAATEGWNHFFNELATLLAK
ncbi:SRPBCC family protein [Stackebrandtia albiflava]|uniref:SRPBCC family protein n=1 Tax=Stackebrandtia albiflava TaxID=406432 RepID=UPI0031E8FA72